MTPIYHYLGSWKDFIHYIGRGGVCILPVNSNLHPLLFSYLKGSITLSSFGRTTIEWLLDDFITALLTEMVVVQGSPIQIIYYGKCGIFTMPAHGLPHAISSGYCTFPQDPSSSSFLSFISCLAASHCTSNMTHNRMHVLNGLKKVPILTAFDTQRMLQCFIISSMSATSNNECHLNTHGIISLV